MTAQKTLCVATFGVSAAFLLVGAVARDVRAGAPTEQLKHSVDKAIKLLQDPELKAEGKLKERRAAIRKVANETFDFTETARRSLARHWRERSTREREEFVRLFGDLLERAYFSRIDQYGGERVIYLGESLDGDRTTVRTKVITKQGTEVPVDYRMHRRGGRWLVYDVVVEGVSLIRNYRSQLSKIIRKSSYEDLVKRLKAKQAKYREREAGVTR
ncbi:MAG: phospholipid-binding protein MlaC [Candidatus Methylomirabilia bacterium]